MFSKVLSVKKNKTLFSPVFQFLNEVESGLAERTEQFVLNSDNSDVVAALANLTPEQKVSAGMVFGHYYQGEPSKQELKRAKNVIGAFKKLLPSVEVQNTDVSRRFGLVIDALNKNQYHTHYYYEDVPGWVQGFTCGILQYASNQYSDNYRWPKTYTGNWFMETLTANDVPPVVGFAMLLERQHTYGDDSALFTHFIGTLNWEAWISCDEFYDWLNDLHYSAKVTLATHIQKLCDLNDNLPLVTQLITDKSKQVREKSKPLISGVDINLFRRFALERFEHYPPGQRKELAILLLLHGDEDTADQLQLLTNNEKSKAVKEAIQAAISNRSASTQTTETLDIPDSVPVTKAKSIPSSFTQALVELVDKEREKSRIGAEDEIKSNKGQKWKATWQQNHYNHVKKITAADISDTVKYINDGQGKAHQRVMEVLVNSKLLAEETLHLEHIVRILNTKDTRYDLSLRHGHFASWLRSHPERLEDLRQLIPIFHESKIPLRTIANWYLQNYWGESFELPMFEKLNVWPFFAEHREFLDEAFGLRPSEAKQYQEFDLGLGMLVAVQFPVIPEQYLQVLYAHALSPSKTYGPLARKTLEQYDLVQSRIIDALKSSKQDERIVAADWIAKLQLKDAIPALKAALKKESRETARASLLSALHDLEQSIDEYLSPKALLAEAEKGLKKAIPKSIVWFPFESLPPLKWKMEKPVNPEVVKWWVVLACKLKQPEGNPLLSLYLNQLDVGSQKALGYFIFQVFIGHDAMCPSDEEANSYAEQHQQTRFDVYKHWAKFEWGEDYKNKTIQDAYNDLFREKKGEYQGSAISAKGILCLGSQIQAADAVQLITRYMKDHYTRRHQIEALLISFANNNDPIAIQLLLSIARRHRTNSVQEKAKVLVGEIAERNGWTHDELADRTIPTAGFELGGSQVLELGSRNITIRLTDDLKVQIENESGKIVKALPASRQDDDPEKAKDAKKQFSTLKKELKQVNELQTARLYEAMCVNRSWPYEEWEEYLFNHPVMTHLVQRLVWIVTQDGDDFVIRPTAERELIDIQDEELDIVDGATIRLAHASSIEQAKGKQWEKLLREEKISQPFKQFNVPSHQLTDEERQNTKLDYHLGWVTDTYTFRAILTKLGYKRGDAEGGGYFSHYYKDFGSLNLRLVIEFSGNCLPEEQMPAVLYHVAFVTPDQRGWLAEDAYKKIDDVPTNLVMEAMLDYEAIAKKANYEEKWQSKCPW